MSSTNVPLDEHGPAATLTIAEALVRSRREVEAEELRVVAHWAALHATDPADDAGATRVPGGDRLRRFGGDGTPRVRELSTYELAVARGENVQATRSLLADTLDLRHRLPRLWAAVQAGEVPVWVARKVASASRVLTADRCWVVDTAVTGALHHSPGKVLQLAEAKVVEADPEGHAGRVEAERLRTYVGFNRVDAAGMRTMVARMHAGDAAAVEATIVRVSEILRDRAWAQHQATGHPVPSHDRLRAEALTWLARPAELLALLLEHADDASALDLPPEPEEGTDPGESPEPQQPGCLLAFPADLLDALRAGRLDRLRPRAVLYVHVHQHALEQLSGVARAEGIGPVALGHLGDLLGQHRLTVQPVLDLADHVSTAAYEFPAGMQQRLHLLFDGDAFPHAGTRPDPGSRRLDHDHVVPWHDTGPPGRGAGEVDEHQTSVANGQPLTRGAHRAKTHLGYRCEPVAPGVVRWRTPHGLTRVVDHRGTHDEGWVERALRDVLAAHDAA